MSPAGGARFRALVLALVLLSGGAALLPATPTAAGDGASSELILQPCLAGGGRCETPPVTTGDGRIFVQLVPVYTGVAHVYVEGEHGPRTYAFSCHSPPATDCSRLLHMGHAGTYVLVVEFAPHTTGALLVEALTPS